MVGFTFQTVIVHENLKFAGEADSANQEAVEELLKYLLNVIQEKLYREEKFLQYWDDYLFNKEIDKWSYVMQMASKAPGFK